MYNNIFHIKSAHCSHSESRMCLAHGHLRTLPASTPRPIIWVMFSDSPRYCGAHVNHAHEDQTLPLELRFPCEMLQTRWLLISRHFIWYLSISPPLQHIPELDIKINLQKCVPNTFCLMIKNLSKPGI